MNNEPKGLCRSVALWYLRRSTRFGSGNVPFSGSRSGSRLYSCLGRSPFGVGSLRYRVAACHPQQNYYALRLRRSIVGDARAPSVQSSCLRLRLRIPTGLTAPNAFLSILPPVRYSTGLYRSRVFRLRQRPFFGLPFRLSALFLPWAFPLRGRVFAVSGRGLSPTTELLRLAAP